MDASVYPVAHLLLTMRILHISLLRSRDVRCLGLAMVFNSLGNARGTGARAGGPVRLSGSVTVRRRPV